jgi:hypothetical protein
MTVDRVATNTPVIRYQIITEEMPGQRTPLAWLVYGGNDGSVLVYKPPAGNSARGEWVKLLQSRTKDHGYWCVSVARIGEKHFKRDVQTIILYAYNGPPSAGQSHAMHLNDDRDDNRRTNLKWGTKAENIAMRKEHSLKNRAERELFVGASLGLNCERLPATKKLRTIIWTGHLDFVGTAVKSQGQEASHVVNDLFYRWKKSRQGIRVFPGQGKKSDMPEKDQDTFAETSHSGLLIPSQFDVPVDANHCEWNGMRFSRVLVRRN